MTRCSIFKMLVELIRGFRTSSSRVFPPVEEPILSPARITPTVISYSDSNTTNSFSLDSNADALISLNENYNDEVYAPGSTGIVIHNFIKYKFEVIANIRPNQYRVRLYDLVSNNYLFDINFNKRNLCFDNSYILI